MPTTLYWAAAVLAAVFAVILAGRYRERHAPFYLWWTFSFSFYVMAFVMEALTVATNWHLLWQYQLYVIASSSLVGTMSVGTTYLAVPRRWAHGYAGFIILLILGVAVTVFALPPALHGSWTQLNAGIGGIVGPTQLFYVLMASIGGTVVILGALWSWWKTRRLYNLLIAAGALVSTSGGTLASTGIGLSALPLMNIIGLLLIFWGYLESRAVPAAGAAATPRVSSDGRG
ncbi:MAG: hypothetical protein OWV35_12895 [Firmicutes bacterium]|nr:hypothetical protein [Bacillota bacterium]